MNKQIKMITDIPQYSQWRNIEIPQWGWSQHNKFKVTDGSGQAYLVRVADISTYGEREAEFKNFQRLFSMGINVSRPFELGICNGGKSVYMLMGWIEGVAVEDVLKDLDSATQYSLGVKAGEILRKMHDASAATAETSWEHSFGKRLDDEIAAYHETGITMPPEKAILEYVTNNRHLLSARPQVIRHGDFHIGNLIITPNGELGLIDCEICSPGDGWEEFGGLVWAARLSREFPKGQVDGYFGGQVPEDFFGLLALYIGWYAIGHVVRSMRHSAHEEGIRDIMANTSFMSAMFDEFTTSIPNWYRSI
ncbi:MAG: phosphotransferase [Defluviitaleaceae bacterium]|nr:phosphotransferase [Defluviitaleaceae bacterium]